MKKIITVAITVFSVIGITTAANAARCNTEYMQDPCSIDGYSVVQTERFVRGRHNWIHDVHHFIEKEKVVHRKRVFRRKRVHRKKHYRYVRRCRRVRVRI